MPHRNPANQPFDDSGSNLGLTLRREPARHGRDAGDSLVGNVELIRGDLSNERRLLAGDRERIASIDRRLQEQKDDAERVADEQAKRLEKLEGWVKYGMGFCAAIMFLLSVLHLIK